MKITIRPHTAVIIPRTITPHTLNIPTHQPLLEERRDILLMRRITLIIHTDIPADLRFILAGFTGVPQILAAAHFVVVWDIAFDGQGVAVHEREVAVAFARVREKAFELRVAADGGVLGADEESAACAVVGGRGKAEFLLARTEAAGADAGSNSVGVVAPVGVFGGEGYAFGLDRWGGETGELGGCPVAALLAEWGAEEGSAPKSSGSWGPVTVWGRARVVVLRAVMRRRR